MYKIRWDDEARDDMKQLRFRVFEIRQIVNAVDEQLTYEPDRTSKQKKMIRPEESLPFEHLEPVWQLRVGEYRVFYDVDKRQPCEEASEHGEYEGVVSIRAVRRKPAHKTTREVL